MMAGETAIWSDIVLPDTVYLERYDGVYTYEGLTPYLTVRQPVVDPMFNVRSPYQIAKGLAERLGIEGYSCESEEELVNEELKKANLTLESLNKQGGIVVYEGNPYRDPKTLKLNTDSGKVQLAVEDFEDEDLDPVPKYEPTPAPPKGYTRLVYGRAPMHTFTRTMNNLWLHNEMPENKLWLNDKVAAKLGIKNDEEVILENQDGKRSNPIKVLVTPGIRPDIVFMYHGFGSKSKHLTRAYGKGAADGFLMTNVVHDRFIGADSKRTNFVRIIKNNRVLNIPELAALPREIPRYNSRLA